MMGTSAAVSSANTADRPSRAARSQRSHRVYQSLSDNEERRWLREAARLIFGTSYGSLHVSSEALSIPDVLLLNYSLETYTMVSAYFMKQSLSRLKISELLSKINLLVMLLRSSCASSHTLFMFQKPALALDASTIAGERTVGSDHAVTRHDNSNRI